MARLRYVVRLRYSSTLEARRSMASNLAVALRKACKNASYDSAAEVYFSLGPALLAVYSPPSLGAAAHPHQLLVAHVEAKAGEHGGGLSGYCDVVEDQWSVRVSSEDTWKTSRVTVAVLILWWEHSIWRFLKTPHF